MDALRADSADTIVLVTPAFPETGRTVYQGNLFVGAVPLNESPLKDHPLNPMHDSNLVRVLARQSKTRVGLVDLAIADARAGCGSRTTRRSPAKVSAPPSLMRCSTAISKLSARSRWIIGCPSAPPASGLGWPGRWSPRASQIGSGEAPFATHRSAGRRRASPAVARRRRCSRSPAPRGRCRCCISIPSRSWRARMRRAARWPGRRRRIEQGPVLIA